MTMIALDTDQAEAAANALNTAYSNFTSTLQTLGGSVQSLASTWEGAAQAQFLSTWEQWQQSFQQALDAVTPLMDGIRREKQELEEADATSSYT